MRILIAPDSFKESMSAIEVCDSIEKGFRKVFPKADYIKVPIGDGGEGTVDSFVEMSNGELIHLEVTGPSGQTVKGYYGLSEDRKTAFIEVATAVGLHLVSYSERNPMHASTWGVGELIRDALGKDVNHIILGIGGTSTNDGGIGMAAALGVQFYDTNNQLVEPIVSGLKKIHAIDLSSLDPRIQSVRFEVACDVSNTLVGAKGATHVFGKQKGATSEMLQLLEDSLVHYADVIEESLNIKIKDVIGGGAGGGLGAAAVAFLNAELKSGIDVLLDYIQFDERLADVNLVITGEGKIDEQTIYGKAPIGVSKRAVKQSIPVIAVAGSLGEGFQEVYNHGIDAVFCITNGVLSLEKALMKGPENLEDLSENIGRLILAGL